MHGYVNSHAGPKATDWRKNPTYTLSGTLGYEDTLTSVPMVEVPFSTQTFTAYGYADLINKVRKSYGYNHFPLVIAGAGIGASTTNAPAPAAQSGTPSPGMTPGTPPTEWLFSRTKQQHAAADQWYHRTQYLVLEHQLAPVDGGAVSTAPAGGGGALVITVLRDHPRYNPNRPLLQMKYEAKGAFITRGWDPNQDTIASDIQNAKSWISAPPAVPPVQDPSEFPKILFFFGGQTKVE